MCNAIRIFLAGAMLLPIQAVANSEYQQWMQQQQNAFQEYRDERDREFAAFLKNNWKEVRLQKGVMRDDRPKPVSIPVVKPDANPFAQTSPIVIEPAAPQPLTVQPPPVPVLSAPAPRPVTAPSVKPQSAPRAPSPAESPRPAVVAPGSAQPPASAVARNPPVATVAKTGRRLSVRFYGEQLTFYYDPALRIRVPHRIDKRGVSKMWEMLGRADYEPLLQQLQAVKQQHGLNDWAFAVLVNTVSQGIAPADNARTMLDWFILIKAGYEARVAYDDISLYLLLPSKQTLYATPYFTLNGVRFYAVNFEGGQTRFGKVFTYDGEYPGADAALDMRLTGDVIDAGREQVRKLDFSFKGKRYRIDARYSKTRVSFLNTYPQLDLSVYFSAPLASDSASSMHNQLAVYTKDMPQLDAVNFLLRFVQTAWPYQTDDQQFGKENYLFPEETLYYPYADCEDRAVLFAWLVRDLLGLDVIGLDYPGHVATAVLFTVPVQGDAVIFEGKKYIISDPTYINAAVGVTMPDYRNQRPTVIAIN